ncbi:MAG: hypothetical protein OQJ77_06020 [Thiovulaceae bacterium]|nr:hypothetical protein [Sulfurimonadaceae bacterium]MCW9026856.1 hypothetical protein [Sulfurimonadaceae bacterium]
MSSLKLSALLLGAALFLGMGATTLSADMKCGAGKCGSSMNTKQEKKEMKRDNGKCGSEKREMMRDDDMKRGDGKCGGEKKAAKKCGANK